MQSLGVLAPLCISKWCPVVSVVYIAIYTKLDQEMLTCVLWLSRVLDLCFSESPYYLGLSHILNFFFYLQVDIGHPPFLRMCMESGPIRLQLLLARHRIIRVATLRMISSLLQDELCTMVSSTSFALCPELRSATSTIHPSTRKSAKLRGASARHTPSSYSGITHWRDRGEHVAERGPGRTGQQQRHLARSCRRNALQEDGEW